MTTFVPGEVSTVFERDDMPRSSYSGQHSLREMTDALQRWMSKQEFRSWDPYDGLTSPWLHGLQRSQLAARVALQVVKRSPVNLRPLLGIERRVYTKSLSDLASASLLLHRLDPDTDALVHARTFLAQLRHRAHDDGHGRSWGMDLPYASRFAVARADTPNLFQTINAALAFMDAYDLLGEASDLELAVGAIEWLQQRLGTIEADADHVVWRYYPGEDAVVYNVNALAALLLTRVGLATQRDDLLGLAERTLAFVANEQNADGSWYYARGARGRWIDGFHSGYVLEALLECTARTPNRRAVGALERGAEFFDAHLLEPSGLPRYTNDHLYPIEVQNCAQAIQLLAKLGQHHPDMLRLARQAYEQSARHLLVWRRAGTQAYFRLQRGRWLRNDLAAMRWGVAPMLLALQHLRNVEAGGTSPV